MRLFSVGLTLLLTGFALISGAAPAAEAHGKEVQIDLRCSAINPSMPLEQKCEAEVTYSGDRDPVTGADLMLQAVRLDKGDRVRAQPFEATAEPGHYVSTISLDAYGAWTITAFVESPAEGEVELTEEVLPPSGAASPVAQTRARLLVSFNSRDLANVTVLVAHLLATMTLFAATAGVLVVGVLMQGQNWIQLRRRMARGFPLLAAGSFALIGVSGFYNAIYNAPTRSPGLLHPARVADLPFGEAYLIAFGLKMMLAVALLIGTATLALKLLRSATWRLPPIAGGSEAITEETAAVTPDARADACVLLAGVNLATGVAILLTVLVVDYLHLLSHAGTFSGG